MDRALSTRRPGEINLNSTLSQSSQLAARWILQRAGTFVSPPAAVQAAMQLGLPLFAAEQYLDCMEQSVPR